jgi:hypothetical protein
VSASEEFHVFMQIICRCGWMLELADSADLYYCNNPACCHRAQLLQVTVDVRTVESRQS